MDSFIGGLKTTATEQTAYRALRKQSKVSYGQFIVHDNSYVTKNGYTYAWLDQHLYLHEYVRWPPSYTSYIASIELVQKRFEMEIKSSFFAILWKWTTDRSYLRQSHVNLFQVKHYSIRSIIGSPRSLDKIECSVIITAFRFHLTLKWRHKIFKAFKIVCKNLYNIYEYNLISISDFSNTITSILFRRRILTSSYLS